MGEIIRVGLDTSKSVFAVHGVDGSERPVLCRTLRRGEVARFFAALAPTSIGLEACGASHHWARVLRAQGHEVRLLPPQYVKPYVRRGKNDAADAAAICEAMSRPQMRFVPVKTAENQADLMLHTTRRLLIKQRTMLANAIRGHASEFGVTAGVGMARLADLSARLAASADVPAAAQEAFALLLAQLADLDARIATVEARLRQWHRASPVSQRLAAVPGIGPILATALAMKLVDPHAFRSGRDFAAWLGLTPKNHSTAGRQRLGGITRAGDKAMRALLVTGAMAVIQRAKPGRTAPWLLALLARKPKKLAAVALANKTARIVWAMMTRAEPYRCPAAA